MAANWGKQATARIDRTQFDKDELLQQLGTQFNVDFADYEQWTRKTKRPKESVRKPLSQQRIGSAEICRHGTGHMSYREKKEHAKTQVVEKERTERLKILELRIKTRKKTLGEYEKRYAQLIEHNIVLQAEIEGREKNTLDHVKGLLRRYEKYRGGIATLNTNFSKEYSVALQDLADTEERLGRKLEGLQNQVEDMDKNLKAHQDELHVLVSYKDKEYPVKAMKISNLEKEIQSLKIANEEDQDELEHITKTELGKYEKDRQSTQNHITRHVTETAIGMMHPSLKEMALQNMVMKKEIELHNKEQEELERSNKELEKAVYKLLRDPKTNTRQQMFPEFFPYPQKCTPEMEVHLDIPTQEWLPI